MLHLRTLHPRVQGKRGSESDGRSLRVLQLQVPWLARYPVFASRKALFERLLCRRKRGFYIWECSATALLEHCHIHCKSEGFITAQSRKSSQESTGYVFLRCVITGNGSASYMYLGRPWGPFGRVVFAFTWMDACIKPVGWHNWGKSENERNACFYEYRCSGPGSCHKNRVTWCRELVGEEAEQFVAHPFIDPDPARPWLAQRMAVKIPLSA